MGKKLIGIAVIAIIVLPVFIFVGCNLAQSENGLVFYLNRSTQEYTIYAGNGLGDDVIIPSEFNGKPVTKILARGFSHNAKNGSVKIGKTDEIKSIFIPSSIKEISKDTFVGCAELENIVVADDNPFYKSDNNCLIDVATNMLIAGCGTSIIPDYITGIGTNAFLGTKLWNNVPDNDIVYVDKWIVGYKGNLGKIMSVESDVIGIGESAFAVCFQLENITLPPTLQRIGEHAFYNCSSLKDIIIPLSVTHLSSNVFVGCRSLTSIYVEAAEKPAGWNDYWKPIGTSVVWGFVG